MTGIPNPWRWTGTVDRVQYGLVGVTLAVAKFAIDCVLAAVFKQHWAATSYLMPSTGLNLLAVRGAGQQFFLAMIAVAVPFVWIGLSMTVRRLVDARLPVALAACFVIPLVN